MPSPERVGKLFERLAAQQLQLIASAFRRAKRLASRRRLEREPGKVVKDLVKTMSDLRSGAGRQAAAAMREVAAEYDVEIPESDWLPPEIEEELRQAASNVVERAVEIVELELEDEDPLEELEELFASDVVETTKKAILDTGKQAKGGKIVGARRIIHPEWSKAGCCGLCVVAAHRRYRATDLQKIHDRCKCSVLPILELKDGTEIDPGQDLNNFDLANVDTDSIYDLAKGNDQQNLGQVRFKVGDDNKLSVDESTLPKRKHDNDAPKRRQSAPKHRDEQKPRLTKEQIDAEVAAAKDALDGKLLNEEALARYQRNGEVHESIYRMLWQATDERAMQDASDELLEYWRGTRGRDGAVVPTQGLSGHLPHGELSTRTIANAYPPASDGDPVPFTPAERPKLSAGARAHIIQRHSPRSGDYPKKTRFDATWSDQRSLMQLTSHWLTPIRCSVTETSSCSGDALAMA